MNILQLAQMLWRISGRTEPFSVKLVDAFEHDIKRRGVDITKAKTILRWEPQIGLEQGLAEFFNWLRTQIIVDREARCGTGERVRVRHG